MFTKIMNDFIKNTVIVGKTYSCEVLLSPINEEDIDIDNIDNYDDYSITGVDENTAKKYFTTFYENLNKNNNAKITFESDNLITATIEDKLFTMSIQDSVVYKVV